MACGPPTGCWARGPVLGWPWHRQPGTRRQKPDDTVQAVLPQGRAGQVPRQGRSSDHSASEGWKGPFLCGVWFCCTKPSFQAPVVGPCLCARRPWPPPPAGPPGWLFTCSPCREAPGGPACVGRG